MRLLTMRVLTAFRYRDPSLMNRAEMLGGWLMYIPVVVGIAWRCFYLPEISGLNYLLPTMAVSGLVVQLLGIRRTVELARANDCLVCLHCRTPIPHRDERFACPSCGCECSRESLLAGWAVAYPEVAEGRTPNGGRARRSGAERTGYWLMVGAFAAFIAASAINHDGAIERLWGPLPVLGSVVIVITLVAGMIMSTVANVRSASLARKCDSWMCLKCRTPIAGREPTGACGACGEPYSREGLVAGWAAAFAGPWWLAGSKATKSVNGINVPVDGGRTQGL